jgi:GT2 family glycosyltransferase
MTPLPQLTIDVVTPVHDPDPAALAATIESVLGQGYESWRLYLADDGSTDPRVANVLDEYVARDRRVMVTRLETNVGISAATNAALSLGDGEFVAFLDHDDLLHRDALSAVNHEWTHHPDVDIVYTDEDKIDESGAHTEPFFKPAWSPEYLLGCMYFGHLTVYRRTLLDQVGGLRTGYEGSQDWDLALRATERTDRIQHISRVLYHWRMSAASAAGSIAAKPWAYVAAEKALTEALERRQTPGVLEPTVAPGWFRVRRSLADSPTVSIVLPTAGATRPVRGQASELVGECVQSIVDRTDYENYEIVCVLSTDAATDLPDRLARIAGERIRFVPGRSPFSYPEAIDRGVLHARGEYLLLLNDDVQVIAPSWLRILLEIGQDPDIGAVGAKLLFEDGRIQHAGVLHKEGAPVHRHYQQPDGVGYWGSLILNMNYLAVTGACLLTRRSLFDEVGGLSLRYPMNYNDVDYCQKVRVRGKRVVFAPGAQLYHYGSATRPSTVEVAELQRYQLDWGRAAYDDPYGNSNLDAITAEPLR